MATIRVQHEVIDVGADIAALIAGRFDIGGIASFIGTVRDMAKGLSHVAVRIHVLAIKVRNDGQNGPRSPAVIPR